MKKELAKAERKGRHGDTMLAHMTPGDLVVPRGSVTPEVLAALMSAIPEFPVEYYTVGNEINSINPVTGLPEFFDMDGGKSEGMGEVGGWGGGAGDTGVGFDPGDLGGLYDGNVGYDPPADPSEGGDDAGGGGKTGGGGLGGWLDSLAGAWNDPTNWGGPDMGTGMDGSGSGLTDYTPPTNPLFPTTPPPTVPQNPVQQGLMPAPPPSVPRLLPQQGNYYQLLASGNPTAAANLLAPYLSANQNIYGQ